MRDREPMTVVITGASDGIGTVVAQVLHRHGARVIIVGRSPEKTKKVAGLLDIPYYIADFTRLVEVRELAAWLRKTCPRIDVLINNAGGIFGKRELTVDGHEKTFQVNHLAHFLLTTELLDVLKTSQARVICTSSVASRKLSRFDINDLDLEHGFSPNRAYGNAKLANIMFVKELHRRYHAQGLSAAAVHPGLIATHFASQTTSLLRFAYRTPFARFWLDSVKTGAQPLIWLASSSPGTDWQSGEYYEKLQLAQPHPLALNTQVTQRLWDLSEAYTTLPHTPHTKSVRMSA